MGHSVEKIGGTSMTNYEAVRDNVILAGGESGNIYQRIFVVSAYGGVTDLLLENKRTSHPGVYALFADDGAETLWRDALSDVGNALKEINAGLFPDAEQLEAANTYIEARLFEAERCMDNLHRLCQHGHFGLEDHLLTVREMRPSKEGRRDQPPPQTSDSRESRQSKRTKQQQAQSTLGTSTRRCQH